MSLLVKNAGVWKPVPTLKVKVAGTWTQVQNGYVKVAGVWTKFYIPEVVVTYSANAVNQNIQSLFDSFYPGTWTNPAVAKRVVVPAGVIIGSSNPSLPALRTGTGWAGSLRLDNAGEIQGAGGAPNSGAGGHAILCDAAGMIINNTGAIRGGGGAAGVGGTGGGGYYYYTATEGPYYNRTGGGPTYWFGDNIPGGPHQAVWASVVLPGADWSFDYGGYHYVASTQMENNVGGSTRDYYSIYRTYTAVAYTSGGTGGNGGRGQGYGQTNAAGNPGGAGGANAGAGGYGGTGGTWGTPGANGNPGGGGNNGGGGAGGPGGAAGKAISGSSVLNNSGTINGATS